VTTDEFEGITSVLGFSNENSTIFTELWPAGKVVFSPEGPGTIRSDGLLEMKWPWFRTERGKIVVDGRRLDAEAPRMPQTTFGGRADGYGETGFHPSILTFAGPGCWEVTAKLGDETLTFVTLVVLEEE
jgi:hypothetical protein